MPFTLSHAAAVLPLARGPLVASALVAGSMSPDLSYFVALRPLGGDLTHSWLGLVVVDLPLALALLVLFHTFAAPALIALAPRWVRERVVAAAEPPELSGLLVVSVLVGGATHIVWDAFTHYDGFAVLWLPWLKRAEVWPDMPVYQFLQLGSSVVGVLVVLWWCARYLRAAAPAPVPARFEPARRPWLPWAGVVLAAGALAAGNGLRGMVNAGDDPVLATVGSLVSGELTTLQVQTGLVLAAIGAVTGAFLGLVAYGAVRRRRVTSPR